MSLYVDVTQLIHWQGKLTGIPRVMDEIARRYEGDSIKHDEGVRFVDWHPLAQQFKEVSLAQALQSRITSIPAAVTESPPTEPVAFSIRARSKIKRTVATATKRAGVYDSARRLLRRPSATPPETFKAAKLTSGDVLLVLWGEWADPGYIAHIASLGAKGTRLVQVVYDMLPVVTPQYSGHSTEPFRAYNSTILPLCSLVLAISEHTKSDIKAWLQDQNIKVPHIEVIRLGDNITVAKPSAPNLSAYGLHGNDFILCCATIEARKNHTLLYYVYKLAAQRGIRLPKLLIVGRRGWLTDNVFEMITTDPETKTALIPLVNIDDARLTWLYQNCLFTVYPSFYEGWGLPIAESLAHGVPCICSNTSSMPEVGGDLVDYFSPTSSDECLAAIQKLLDPVQLAKARQRAASYNPISWDTTYSKVSRLVKELNHAR